MFLVTCSWPSWRLVTVATAIRLCRSPTPVGHHEPCANRVLVCLFFCTGFSSAQRVALWFVEETDLSGAAASFSAATVGFSFSFCFFFFLRIAAARDGWLGGRRREGRRGLRNRAQCLMKRVLSLRVAAGGGRLERRPASLGRRFR